MIEITIEAQDYFRRLLSQQDEPGLGLRIAVRQAGTPHADCDLTFCPTGHSQEHDVVIAYPDFNLYVDVDSVQWLEEAVIDFDRDATGGQLTIKAPGIKGTEPAPGDTIEKRVEWLLDMEINPALASHGGRVSLVEVTARREVVLRFGGGCHGCGMVDVTLKQGIQQTLRQKIPEITAVLDVTDHKSGSNPYYAPGEAGRSAV